MILSERIYNSLDVGAETMAVASEISKAFDTVWHAGLLHKLKAYGVIGSIISIVESFLQDRAIEVVLDAQSYTPHAINAGVAHGLVLGPTLFLVYIDDLPDIALSRIGIYTGDTTAYSSIQTSDFFDKLEMTAELEEDLRFIVEWGKSGGYHSMLSRPNCSLSRHCESSLIPLKMNDIELTENASFRSLGLIYTHHPSCIEYCSHISGGAPQSVSLDLLDRSQRRLINLLELYCHQLCSLPHGRVAATSASFTSITKGNVPNSHILFPVDACV